MKIVQEIDCHLSVRAALDETGEFSTSVVATAVYDEKTKAYTSVKMTPSPEIAAKIKAVLEEALKEKGLEKRAAVAIQDSVSVSRNVGLRLGEIGPNAKRDEASPEEVVS